MRTIPSLMVVDDDPDICTVVTDFLQSVGYEIQAARTGREAMDLSQKGLFAAAILNLGLPDVEGHVVLRALKHLVPDTPIIVLSGMTTKETIAEAMQAGAFAFVAKPYSHAHLKATVADAILAAKSDAHKRSRGARRPQEA